MTATLVLRAVEGELRGAEYRLAGSGCWLLGRSGLCALRLRADRRVSRRHCLLEIDDRGAWVQDLGSRNGTTLNGRLIGHRAPEARGATQARPSRRRLRDGDLLCVGGHAFAVSLVEPPAAQA
jgi:pSer/pThr/pTyr-binding forkhead associated (FHA) protein